MTCLARCVVLLFAVFACPLYADSLGGGYSFLNQIVFSPAQMDQSITDTPGAVTVISAKLIKDLGIRTFADLMKLVPGFSVSQDPFVGINRGPNYPTARRIQVLVDGVSEVNPIVGIVRYGNLPFAIQNIARVEITRSPATPTYGANAFYGAINIITKNPFDVTGTLVSAYSTATKNEWDSYIRQAGHFINTALEFEYNDSFFDHYDTFKDSRQKRNDLSRRPPQAVR